VNNLYIITLYKLHN